MAIFIFPHYNRRNIKEIMKNLLLQLIYLKVFLEDYQRLFHNYYVNDISMIIIYSKIYTIHVQCMQKQFNQT
jgi:hypothetical protein